MWVCKESDIILTKCWLGKCNYCVHVTDDNYEIDRC